jgi:BirA family biotin operon repressor/biotin-[acetyl-CoA-carboxylase] ligase
LFWLAAAKARGYAGCRKSMTCHRVIEFDELDSTNRYACSRLRELSDGDVIQAHIQTAGRGRWERKWISDIPGNLSLSLVLKPVGAPVDLPLAGLSQLLAVSTCRVLERHGLRPALKWPNDVQIVGRKIAGILAETVVEGSDFLGLVLGIGVNLNLNEDVLARIDQPATALNLVLGHTVNMNDFRAALLSEFFSRYEAFLVSGFRLIRTEYLQRCQFLGREVELRDSQGIQRGVARDITSAGELQLELADGTCRTVTIGEMFMRSPM